MPSSSRLINRHLSPAAVRLGLTCWVLAVTLPPPAHAAFYGNYTGASYTYLNVQDTSGLYGAPTISRDQLSFSGNLFESDCAKVASCPPNPAMTRDTLSLEIDAQTGHSIERVSLTLRGDATLQSALSGPLAPFAAALFSFSLTADVLEVDGIVLPSPLHTSVERGASIEADDEGLGTHLFSLSEADTRINLALALANAGISGEATRVALQVEIVLTTFAAPGSNARIEVKNVFDLKIVPEPGTALLLGLGLAIAARKPSQRSDAMSA